jgi:hypothetical protein
MKRRLLILLAAAGCMALGVFPAGAVPPERGETVVFDPAVRQLDPDYTEACGFDVFSAAKGHFRVTVYFDQEGQFKRLVSHPSFSTTLSSQYGTLTTADRGMDRVTENPDGTVTIFGTGVHLKVRGGAHAIGLWVLTIDPATGELLDAEYHGRFDVLAPEITDYICDQLGPE